MRTSRQLQPHDGTERVFKTRVPIRRPRQRVTRARAAAAFGSVIYFARMPDGAIKVGVTANLDDIRRHMRLAWADILVFRPAERVDERAMLARLRPHLAHGRKTFHPHPDVIAAINEIREQLGRPPIGSADART